MSAPDDGIGIVSYGTCVPRLRMRVEEPLRVWDNTFLQIIKEQLLVSERVVLSPDEDTVTLAVEAGRQALTRWGGAWDRIGALYLGTCTNPYDSRPSATVLAEALGDNRWLQCADIQFSTKSGTTALGLARAMVRSGAAEYAMAVGSDTMNRHTAPGSLQEYMASAGAGAVILGSDPDEVIARLEPFTTCVSDLADSFRLEGERYIRTGGLPANESGIGLFRHTVDAVRQCLARGGHKMADFDYVVFQQPFGAVPVALAMRLGVPMQAVIPTLVGYELGDMGSAGSLVALGLVLDQARPGQRILLTSYGFGAGADASVLTVTDAIERFARGGGTVEQQIRRRQLVDYGTAMKLEGKFMKVQQAHTAWL